MKLIEVEVLDDGYVWFEFKKEPDQMIDFVVKTARAALKLGFMRLELSYDHKHARSLEYSSRQARFELPTSHHIDQVVRAAALAERFLRENIK